VKAAFRTDFEARIQILFPDKGPAAVTLDEQSLCPDSFFFFFEAGERALVFFEPGHFE
jgi:hypothetical protein